MTTIYLCQIPDLPNDYKHVMDFSSADTQLQYFLSKAKLSVTQNIQADAYLTDLLVNQTLTNCRGCDYLFFRGTDEKVYYYFINAIEQHTLSTSRLTLQLDVFSTYQFDYVFLPSFVERCHVNRWHSTNIPNVTQTVNEGITGTKHLKRQIDTGVSTLEGTYLFSTSTPIGAVGTETASGSGNTGDTEGAVNQITTDELGNVWQFPVSGTVSAIYPNYPDGTYHGAIDIANNGGFKIRSSGVGVVYYVGYDADGYGNYVIVQMTNGSRHWFGHMAETPYVTEGQSVGLGTVLGIVGTTGNSTGNHCHWEIRVSPYAYDSTCMINPSPSTKLYDIIEGVGD